MFTFNNCENPNMSLQEKELIIKARLEHKQKEDKKDELALKG